MPAWLIIAIVLILAALSSKNSDTQTATSNSTQAEQNANVAQQNYESQMNECGSRCSDVANGYKKQPVKE